MVRAAGLFRAVHPFPSLLTSSATAAIASMAGADGFTIGRLFLAMLGIQVSIGALNDVIDAPLDALAKPRKPIAAGLVRARTLGLVAGAGAVVGLVLSAISGLPALLAGACCLGLGWLYDLRLSRTALSWLPLAIALPLLPIHAWLGATGSVPASLVTLIPIGLLAGAGLALANGIVDVERDAGTRRSAMVVTLGRQRAWILHAALLSGAVTLVVLLGPVAGSQPRSDGQLSPEPTMTALVALREWAPLLGSVVLLVGAVVLRATRAAVRERGWELEALGVAMLGIGWIAGTASVAA